MRPIGLVGLLIPALLFAQEFTFELQPEAFPVEIEGWQPHCPWAGGVDYSTPEFCDIDGDDDLDYFTGSWENYFWFFENGGTPSDADFHYMSSTFDSLYCLASGAQYKADINFCDIDEDGDFDAFTSNGLIGIAANVGTSTQRNFPGPVDTLLDVYGQWVVGFHFDLADIDADGDFDLFSDDYSPYSIRFYENIGTSQYYCFQLMTDAWQNIQVSAGWVDPAFGDIDTDGDLDLLVGTGEGTIYFYRNDGDSANPQMTYVTDNYFNIDVQEDASPELADIDNDGDLDLFVGRSPSSATIDNTQGDVFFYENIGTPEEPFFRYVTSNYLAFDNGRYAKPRLVDIDADGDPDLISRVGYNLLLYRNQGSLTTPYFVYESDSFGGITINTIQPWFCDVDADEDCDLLCGMAAIPGPPGLYLYINTGTPQVPEFTLYSNDLVPGVFTQNTVVIIPSTADIDADGDQDLFVSGSDDLYYFFENTGTPTQFQFQLDTASWQGINPWGHQNHCFYDIDDDLDLDLFISSASDYLHPWDKNLMFYRNVGTPEDAQMILENEDLFPELMIWQAAPYLLDMDQDGDGDLFVGDSWGGIRFFRNVTGEPAVPPLRRHPQAGLHLSLGPNPANPVTWVTFHLPTPQKATLAVYNLLGQKVATLAQGLQPPGTNTYLWNAAGFASGVYVIRLETEKENFVSRVTVLK